MSSMSQDIFETVYTLGELKLACQRIKNDGNKVIAIHGWQDNSNSFVPLMKRLPNLDWYAIDLPGHGLSDWRHPQAHYYFVDYIDDLYNLVNKIAEHHEDKIILVGHSMGAMIANLFSACFPEKVQCIIAIEGIATVTTPDENTVNQLVKSITNRAKKSEKRVFKDFQQAVKARLAVSDFGSDIASLIMRRNTQEVTEGVELITDPKLKHASGFRFNPAQCKEICRQTAVPIMLIRGENGYTLVNQAISIYGEQFIDLTIKTVPGGHHCHLQSVEETSNLIDVYVNLTT